MKYFGLYVYKFDWHKRFTSSRNEIYATLNLRHMLLIYWIISRSTINNYLRINDTLVSHLKYGIAMCRNLFNKWGLRSSATREGRKMCVHYLFANDTTPRIYSASLVLKKTAAAVQQFRKSTSCTFSPRRFLNVEKNQKRLTFSIIFWRQLKQAAAYLPTIQSTAVPWHSALTNTRRSMEIRSDGRHRLYGDSSHISSRSN